MNFLLKIVEGPNKGAEITLVEGVAVTLGKGDACDIVLADSTLPEEPLSLEASENGVNVGGEPLDQLHVKTVGSTSFAIGPADSAWGDLVWPKAETKESEAASEPNEKAKVEADTPPSGQAEEKPAEEPVEKKRRGGCLGCLVATVLLLFVLAALGWFFREKAAPYVDKARPYAEKVSPYAKKAQSFAGRMWKFFTPKSASAEDEETIAVATLSDIAAKYSLDLTEDEAGAKMYGNFKTRRERLAATAEAYAAQPGVEIDFSDDESLHSAAEDALFTFTEGALSVVSATNRVVALSGVSPSSLALKNTLEMLSADMPKLRNIDVSRVVINRLDVALKESQATENAGGAVASVRSTPVVKSAAAKAENSFPVCGILTAPYPCLVLKNGARLLEGASIGGGVITKIEADSVTLTNSTGRFTWKP